MHNFFNILSFYHFFVHINNTSLLPATLPLPPLPLLYTFDSTLTLR